MIRILTVITGCLLTATLLTGCPNTGNMRTAKVDVLNPAEITLPAEIESLLVIDRTVYTGDPFVSNEARLAPEIPGETREAVQTLIFFLQRYLGASPRFEMAVATEALTGNSFNQEFPRPIPWQTVRELTRRYQADALVAIEVYASDFDVSNPRPAAAQSQPMLVDPDQQPDFSNRPQTMYEVNAAANIVFGFRVYDPDTETIVDEQLYRKRETWDAQGEDPPTAMQNLIPRERAIGDLIHLAGMEYSRRIAPILVPVSRSYFGESRNVPAMAAGSALAETGRWEQAATVWESAISEAPEREAGQLAYNLAIAHEALGNLDKAREWASKAHTEYSNAQARAYLDELDGKLSLLERANEKIQTGGGLQLPGVQIQK